jgi:hypothetical protein
LVESTITYIIIMQVLNQQTKHEEKIEGVGLQGESHD